jgi:hypothetical protein
LGNISFSFAIEELPELTKKLQDLLGDNEVSVRLAALTLIGNLNYRTSEKMKKEYREMLDSKLVDLTYNDKDINLRGRALSVLADLRSTDIFDVIIKLALEEPEETFPKLNFQNILMRVAEGGLGFRLAERLYSELNQAKTPEAEKRLKQVLEWTRQVGWSR